MYSCDADDRYEGYLNSCDLCNSRILQGKLLEHVAGNDFRKFPQIIWLLLEIHQEQEKIVQSLEASQSRQNLTWRVVFATLTLVFSGFFLISACWQAIFPWELKFHAYFMEDMSSVSVVVADVAEAVVFASMAWGLLSSKSIHINSLWISLGAGFGLAVFWLYQMQSLSRMHWDLLWLPLGPCSCGALCLYVDHLLVETERDVGKLRTAMYHFKRT